MNHIFATTVKRTILAVLALIVIPLRVQAITINFDEFDVSAGPKQIASDHYLYLGVQIALLSSSGMAVDPTIVAEPLYGNGASSDPNAVAFGFSGSVLEVLFFDAVSGLAGVTDFVSFAVGDLSNEADPIVARAFDVNGLLLGTRNFTSQPTNVLGVGDFGVLSFALSGIHRLLIADRSPSGASLDDLSYNHVRAAAVPEPASAALLLTGLLGGGGWRRLKRTAEVKRGIGRGPDQQKSV